MWAAASLDRALRRRGVRSLSTLTATMLLSYAPPPRLSGSPPRGALVRSIARYLEERGELVPTLPTPTEHQIADYRHYLGHICGLCDSTIAMKSATAREFLMFVNHDFRPVELHDLRIADIEAFVAKICQRVGRDRIGHVMAALRMFLRFLAIKGKVTPGLDAQVDSPRVYRGERLPRALAWDTVLMLVRSIDRTTPKGRRDYAMFLLIATYGLRASEVRALDLDDISWRTRQIRFPRPKVGTPLLLPLTDEVGTALIDYLRHGRPRAICRQIFLRVEIPIGPLGRGAIGDAFRAWARRAGIALPVPGGPHCMRHALALHLLRQGAALKTIGDLLGHRSAEATGKYLRLHVNDLRDVALPLPPAAAAEEVRP